MENNHGILTDVWSIIIGALGAALSMQFVSGLSPLQKATMVLTGTIFSVLFTNPLIELVGVPPAWNNGIAFLVGLFGWSVVGSVIIAIRKADWWGLLMEVVRRIFGRGG